MEDLARRTQEWKKSHPLKRWRQRKGYPTSQAALVLDIWEARILKLELGESPTEDEIKTITQRTGITKDDWIAWERAIPRGRGVSSEG
jgi:transcriptional regulator with XRE-family HTH domain